MAYMYLYWKFEERPNAFAFIERVENLKEGTNTITQCNTITFYIELGEYAQSAKLWKSIANGAFKQVKARAHANAELAYCYSLLCSTHHGKVIKVVSKSHR